MVTTVGTESQPDRDQSTHSTSVMAAEVRMNDQSFSRLKRPRYEMPDDIRDALLERPLMDAYRSRPPYQQNDYIGWITRAKRQEGWRNKGW